MKNYGSVILRCVLIAAMTMCFAVTAIPAHAFATEPLVQASPSPSPTAQPSDPPKPAHAHSAALYVAGGVAVVVLALNIYSIYVAEHQRAYPVAAYHGVGIRIPLRLGAHR